MIARVIAVLLACLVLAVLPQTLRAQEGLTPSERGEMEAAIDMAIKTQPSGTPVRKPLSERTAMTIIPEKATSGRSGGICNSCTDPCRQFSLQIDTDGGAVMSIYQGRKCMIAQARDPHTAPWAYAEPLRLVATERAIAPALLAMLRSNLVALQYLPPGEDAPSSRVMAALDAFRADAFLSGRVGQAVGDLDVVTLKNTLARSRMPATDGCAQASAAARACGALGG
ncbi:hypothetical protein BTR14_13470 [Rhizobium rhizosphaerae]|uniref:Uncharacterized protein n=1 Tax=Xaviernesmea rhizosphaerae TaxID=1672749 RepID=A0ABX3PCJ4_9HYPH|nr:hypothetical protein [Xaviernesmea rhizosphaerae]OQP85789.1 hypothetical protein BTR14_13470 [Xaviernesmea rhizosphaerae]